MNARLRLAGAWNISGVRGAAAEKAGKKASAEAAAARPADSDARALVAALRLGPID